MIFEIIIFDDGFTDSPRKIIKRLSQYLKIKVIYQQNKVLNVTNSITFWPVKIKFILSLPADDSLYWYAHFVMSNMLNKDRDQGLMLPDDYIPDEKHHYLSGSIGKNAVISG